MSSEIGAFLVGSLKGWKRGWVP